MKPLGRKTSIALMLSSVACAGASRPSMTTVESQLDRAVREDVAKGFYFLEPCWSRAARRHFSTWLTFKPLVDIHEGQGGLGWFIGGTAGGVARVFMRGNEDFGPNSLVYAYPASDTLIIVLTHSGDANDDLSWSRFVHAKLERVLFQ